MATYNTKIKLYCEANSKVADFGPNGNIVLQNDGSGDYFEVYLYQDSGGNVITTEDRIWFYGYKLIG